MECFYEAQAVIDTEDLKRSISERKWDIYISYWKTAREVSHQIYFMEKFVNEKLKLNKLVVDKGYLSEDEKKLLNLCLTNVRCVALYYPVNFQVKYLNFELLRIDFSYINLPMDYFQRFVNPWIERADVLILHLHNDTDFINYICKWLNCLKIKMLEIRYRGKYFDNIEELKETIKVV